MSGSMGLAFKISATDQATAKLDAVNKRIVGMSRSAGQAGKSLALVGEGSTSGIDKLSEGMLSLGNNSLGAFRAIEQMVSPMAAITSAASIGGMVALEKAWASTGNTMSKTAYALNMPVSKLSGLEQGFKLAGSSAAAADKTVTGMNETLHNAFYGRDATAQANLNALGINWKDENGNIADTQVALGKLADWVKAHSDPHAQARAITSVGGDVDALPALKEGQAGLDAWIDKAKQTGSVWTEQMAANAIKVQGAFSQLEEDLQGIGNRIADSWSDTATKMMTRTSDWIEHNKGLADSFIEIGSGIMALGALKPAAWLMRMLGLGALVPSAPAVVIGALGAGGAYAAGKAGEASANTTNEAGKQGYSEVVSTDDAGNPTAYRNPATGKTEPAGTFDPRYAGKSDVSIGDWWRNHAPTWAGGSKNPADPEQLRSYFRSQGWSDPQVSGILGNFKGESNLDAGAVGDKGASAGLGQWRDQRRARFQSMYGHDVSQGSPMEQAQFTQWELTHTEKAAGDRLRATTSAREAGSVFSQAYERPQDVEMNASLRGQYAEGFQASIAGPASPAANGQVHVTVELKGAPPGTTAKAIASGAATSAPPRIETAMAGAGR